MIRILKKECNICKTAFNTINFKRRKIFSECAECRYKKTLSKKIKKVIVIIPAIINLVGEIWKDIIGYEGLYQVSNFGRIKTLKRKGMLGDKLRKYYLGGKGYFQMVVQVGERRKTHKIHRLVALAFVPNIKNKPQVNHKNGNKQNNNADNLEWATSAENVSHYWNNLRKHPEEFKKKTDKIKCWLGKKRTQNPLISAQFSN